MHTNVRRPLVATLVSAATITGLLLTQIASADVTGTLLPSSDGTYTQFTPKSGGTHYTQVSEATCDGTTTYNSTTVVGNRDSYAVSLAGIPDGSTITAIQITPCASQNSSGGSGNVLKVFYRFNGVNSADLGSYTLSGTTPTVLAATNAAGLSLTKNVGAALEVGAVYTSGSKGARLSRLATVITYTIPAPAAPSALTASASGTDAVLTWTDNSSIETGFKVERSLDGVNFSQISTTTANVTSYTDPGRTENTTYYYRVRAYNATGNSSYSNTASVTMPFVNPPVAPSSLSGNASSTPSVALWWSDNSTNEQQFNVERSDDNVNFSVVATTSANNAWYTDRAVVRGQTYYYRVNASNGAGYSGYSNTLTTTVP